MSTNRLPGFLISLITTSVLLLQFVVIQKVRAADLVTSFEDPEQAELYHHLLEEYRCLKCQNQNLADSNASLAGDLRREIREQILAGKTQNDIDEYLVARYGEFVLYRPRFSAKTATLWIGPFILLVVALIAVITMVRRRALTTGAPAGTAEYDERLHSDAAQMPDKDKLDKARKLLSDR